MLANSKLVETASIRGMAHHPSLYMIYNAAFGKTKAEFSVLLRRPGGRAAMLRLGITLVNPPGQA